MSGYTKLFSSITDSTIWTEPDATRLVWITMLAMADQNGHIGASVPGLAARARVTLDDCLTALNTFLAPDEWSRTKDFEGRRIAECDGGWILLNHQKYRELRDAEDRREQSRLAMQKLRASKKQPLADVNNVNHSLPELTQAEASTEASTSTKKETTIGQNKFDLFWDMYPRKVKKKTAEGIWKRKKLDALTDKIIFDIGNRIDNHAPWKSGFIPHPTTYLNGELWNDEIQLAPITKTEKKINAPHKDDHPAIDRLGKSLGIPPKRDEDYWQYRQRLIEAQR